MQYPHDHHHGANDFGIDIASLTVSGKGSFYRTSWQYMAGNHPVEGKSTERKEKNQE